MIRHFLKITRVFLWCVIKFRGRQGSCCDYSKLYKIKVSRLVLIDSSSLFGMIACFALLLQVKKLLVPNLFRERLVLLELEQSWNHCSRSSRHIYQYKKTFHRSKLLKSWVTWDDLVVETESRAVVGDSLTIRHFLKITRVLLAVRYQI